LILPYEHLVENTEDSLAQVIRLLVPHHKPDLDRIQRVVDAEHVIHQEMRSGVRKRRKIEDFSYWNDVYREMFDHKMDKSFGFTYREWLQKNL
jgi:predicted CopG family antitoxin